jgi:amino acid carrier protein
MQKDDLVFSKKACVRLMGIGVPMGLQCSITAIGSVIMQWAVNMLGSTAVAAVTAAGKTQNLLTVPLESVGTAMATYAGQNLGASRMDRVRKGTNSAMLIILVYGLASAFILHFTDVQIMGLFLDTAKEVDIVAMGREYLFWNSVFFVPLGALIVWRYTIQGLGFSSLAMLAGVAEMIARTAVAIILVPILGYFGAELANPAAWVAACLFAVSGLICWCGISQVVSNSVSEAFQNAFSIPPLVTTLVLTALAAVIVLRKEATVKSLDVMVPIMAGCYFVMTLWIILTHLPQLPDVFARIFSEALGLRQAVGGGFGAVVMNGIKRGLFSNEAGSGSAPCAAAAAECDDPVKMGLVQALGVLIDTIVICSCTAFVMLLAPESVTSGLQGMNLLQAAMQYHLGSFGVVFIAVTLALFSFSTFIGILYYARCNVAYLFGDSWFWQTAYKVLALVMLVVGGMQAYTVVWDLGDVGIGLMTIFNMLALYPLAGEALTALREYEAKKKLK